MATLATATEKKAHMSADEKPERKPHRGRVDDKFKIFCGTANESLCDEVCAFLGLTRGQAVVTRFSDGEAYVQIQENVRGADVFAMQPTCRPVDEHLMELLLMIDALKRASARRITAVIPYYGYARQDRKDRPRAPISSKLVADLLTTAGADRALIVDLHALQIQGFFNIPVDHLFASPVLVGHFKKLNLPNLTVVSPDAGGVERARFFAKQMDAALAIVDKRRVDMNVAEVMHVIGDVNGRTCLVIDDLIDTAGTLVKTASALKENGACAVYGAGKSALSVSLDPRQVSRILHSATGHNTIFDLALDGERSKAMIVDWQYEPIKGSLLHIDLKRIAMDQKLTVNVPIVLKGEAAGVKQQGGILEQVLRELEVECLPSDIPNSIEADVTELVFGRVLRVADLPHSEKLRFLTDADQTVAHITAVKEEEVPAPEVAAAEAAAAPAEPEVIKKGKQEVEGEEGAEPAAAEKPEKPEKKEKK